jgi:pimeloyl-ACP methyl ester carboxylesterase
MLAAPFLLPLWLLGLAALGLLGGGVYVGYLLVTGAVVGLAWLAVSVAMLLVALLGRPLVLGLFRRRGADEPSLARRGDVVRLRRPDEAELRVESHGQVNRPTIVLTHGWGTDAREWQYATRELGERFHVLAWDLRGLGESDGPDDHDYGLERMAADLDAVVQAAGHGPVVLVGHSIGGMIIQTYCRLFPERLGAKVVGLALVNTTHTNPAGTTMFGAAARLLQGPLWTPLLHLMIWLWPLVWLMNWLSYQNGTAHLLTMAIGVGGHESRGQLDLAARFAPMASPAVLARGVLAMFRFEETATLPTIPVPTLVVTGDVDRVTVPEASRTIGRSIPNAELVELRPAGHMAPFEQHAAFARALAPFCDRCFGLAGEAVIPRRQSADNGHLGEATAHVA